MTTKNGSAEIFELDDARARLRAAEVDPKNFLAVGPYLEAVRAKQGLSLDAIAEGTHIKAAYLEAIEQMDVASLPSKPFAIGFAKVYAEALGLDPAPVVDRFKAEAGFSAAAAPREEQAPVVPAQPAGPAEPSKLSFIAVIAIIAFMIWCALMITRPRDISEPLKLGGVPTPPVEAVDAAPASEHMPAPEGVTPQPLPVIIEARAIEKIEPIYPPNCEVGAAPIETVTLAYTITPEGQVVTERVVDTTNKCFDRAALNAITRWRFEPRTVDGAPRPAFEQIVKFNFLRPS